MRRFRAGLPNDPLWRGAALCVGVLALGAALAEQASSAGEKPPAVATFSILGFDPDTGMVGGAVQSRVFSVGNGVLWAAGRAVAEIAPQT